MDEPTAAEQPPTANGASSPPPRPPRGRRSLAWLFGLLPIVLVIGAAAAYLLWWQPQQAEHSAASSAAAEASATPQPAKVLLGRDYYVFVKTIELYPEQPDGGKWDAVGNSAPDITYSLMWQDHVVYTSPTRENTLIGIWDPIKLNVHDALLSGELEPSSTLNQGAIVNVTEGAEIAINVWDKDPTGLGSEAAGQIVLPVEGLLQGDNVFNLDASDTNAIKRLVLGTTDTSQPIKNLIEALSSP